MRAATLTNKRCRHQPCSFTPNKNVSLIHFLTFHRRRIPNKNPLKCVYEYILVYNLPSSARLFTTLFNNTLSPLCLQTTQNNRRSLENLGRTPLESIAPNLEECCHPVAPVSTGPSASTVVRFGGKVAKPKTWSASPGQWVANGAGRSYRSTGSARIRYIWISIR